MSKVLAILVICDSDDLGGIISDFFSQFQIGNSKPEIKADYIKPLISKTAKTAIKNIRKFSPTENKIINYIREHDRFAVISDFKEAKITASGNLYICLKRLVNDGILIKTGEFGSYRYELANIEEVN